MYEHSAIGFDSTLFLVNIRLLNEYINGIYE